MHGNDGFDLARASASTPSAQALQRWQQVYDTALEDAVTQAATDALIRAIPEAIPDALLVVDAEGAIVLVNTRLELMFGYPRSELIGRTPEVLLPAALRERHVKQRQRYADNPRARAMGPDMALRGRRKNGSEFGVLVALQPVVTPAGICTIAVVRRVAEAGPDHGQDLEHF